MAAYPYPQHNLFLFEDPSANFLPNPELKIPEYLEQPKIATSFQQFYTPEHHFHQTPISVGVHENNCFVENITNVSHSTDSSSVVINKPESTGDSRVTQKVSNDINKKRKNTDGSSITSVQSKGAREVKGKRQKKCNRLTNGNDGDDDNQEDKKDLKQAPEGYIHVRARRGQATDSHSLAERVRREKISERMKLLQSLVPGCEKVSGKALMLDEIINYVQSLQYQVEFLSLKLTSTNPMFYDFGMDMDALMVTPERLNGLVSPLQNIQACNPIQANFPAPFPETTSSSSSALFQQEHMPDILPQENRQLLWDVDEQRQKHMNQSGFSINNLCSFH